MVDVTADARPQGRGAGRAPVAVRAGTGPPPAFGAPRLLGDGALRRRRGPCRRRGGRPWVRWRLSRRVSTTPRPSSSRRSPSSTLTARSPTLRRREYGRLDAEGQVYLDYTGGGLHAASQIDAHADAAAPAGARQPALEQPDVAGVDRAGRARPRGGAPSSSTPRPTSTSASSPPTPAPPCGSSARPTASRRAARSPSPSTTTTRSTASASSPAARAPRSRTCRWSRPSCGSTATAMPTTLVGRRPVGPQPARLPGPVELLRRPAPARPRRRGPRRGLGRARRRRRLRADEPVRRRRACGPTSRRSRSTR